MHLITLSRRNQIQSKNGFGVFRGRLIEWWTHFGGMHGRCFFPLSLPRHSLHHGKFPPVCVQRLVPCQSPSASRWTEFLLSWTNFIGSRTNRIKRHSPRSGNIHRRKSHKVWIDFKTSDIPTKKSLYGNATCMHTCNGIKCDTWQ